ncbi:MAG: NAD(P)-binding domain-containing protein [Chloroflexi bacterium]|nr:NAD(P)-binding domain-containing protein [Chloroflexota bacterium]
MAEQIETVVIGGGQAGLATSYYLSRHNREHIVLEQAAQAGNVWRNERWDSFTFVTPNWMIRMPGAEYNGNAPDDFMPRDEIVRYFEQYVERFHLPVRYNTCVLSIERDESTDSYCIETNNGVFHARNVVIAIGLFQKSKTPSSSSQISRDILQLSASQYRNPDRLPPGAVLVVGSAQSGVQIVEDLLLSGRAVYLGVGKVGRVPRRYRGKDIVTWLYQIDFFNRVTEKLPSPQARFAGNPQVSGARGGHSINLHQFARDGVRLLGHIQAVDGDTILLAPDLMENLARTDKFETDLIKMIDDYIEKNGIAAPLETLPVLRDGFESPVLRELNLRDAQITSIIWATGFGFDFSWIQSAALDDDGFPIQQHGITDQPGLYFVGLPWLPEQRTGLLLGVGENAAHVVSHIAENR